jgi:YVTN family beta-propeller protein
VPESFGIYSWRNDLKTFIAKALLCVAAILLLAQPVGAAKHPILLVVNRDANTLMFVNADTHQIMGEVRVGTKPKVVAVTPDGKKAFVSNIGDHRNIISVIDVASMKELRKFKQTTYWMPNGLAVSKDGSKLYATYQGSRTVVEIDLETEQIVRAFETRQKNTHSCALSRDNKYLYAVNGIGRNVTVFDLKTGKKIRHVEAGKGCEGIGVKPDGSEVWVANRGEDTIAIISTSDNRLLKKIECGEHPKRIEFTPNGKTALVTCPNSDAIRVIDTKTYEIAATIKTGKAPAGLVIDPDGKRVYVTEVGENAVSVYDLKTHKKTASFEVGEGPYAIAYIKAR